MWKNCDFSNNVKAKYLFSWITAWLLLDDESLITSQPIGKRYIQSLCEWFQSNRPLLDPTRIDYQTAKSLKPQK